MTERSKLNDVKKILRSLIISYPQEMSIHQLNKDFKGIEGYHIPYGVLGYPNLELFLRSLTDTLLVDNFGMVRAVLSKETEHIDKLVSKQRPARKKTHQHQHRPRFVPPRMQQNYNHHHFAYRPSSSSNIPPLLSLPIPQPNIYSTPPPAPLSYYQQAQIQQVQLMFNNSQYVNNPYGIRQQPPLQQMPHCYSNLQHHPMLNPNIPNNLNNNNNNPIPTNSKSSNIEQSNMQRESNKYIPRTNKENGTQKLCSDDRNELPMATSVTPVQNRETVSTAQNANAINIKFFDESYKKDAAIDSKNVYIKSNDLLLIEKNLEKLDLNITNKTNSICQVSISSGSSTDQNYDKYDIDNINNKNDDALPYLPDDDPVFLMDIPKEASKYGTKIEKSQLPTDIVYNGSQFKVFVTEIHNPSKFWFHLVETSHIIDNLMHEIETYYDTLQQDEMLLHRSNINKGQICVAFYLNMWHRAEILNDPTENRVKVYFVDYGTTDDVPLDQLKYILSCFSNVPAQAYRGSLGYIKPYSHRWTRDATYSMLNLVSNIFLYAKAETVDLEEQIVSMLLIDTSDRYDLHINDALIQKRHALLINKSNESVVKGLDKKKYPERKRFYESYPTFEMLETGKYPSFAEIGILLSKGIDYYLLEDENCIPDIDGSILLARSCEKPNTDNDSTNEEISTVSKVTKNTFSFKMKETNPFKLLNSSKLDPSIKEWFPALTKNI